MANQERIDKVVMICADFVMKWAPIERRTEMTTEVMAIQKAIVEMTTHSLIEELGAIIDKVALDRLPPASGFRQ